jgi:hypothetical protein
MMDVAPSDVGISEKYEESSVDPLSRPASGIKNPLR